MLSVYILVTLIFIFFQEAKTQSEQHKAEIQLLQDRLHLETDETFRRKKTFHMVSSWRSMYIRWFLCWPLVATNATDVFNSFFVIKSLIYRRTWFEYLHISGRDTCLIIHVTRT